MHQREDEKWMRLALSLAENAARQGEVPVGAVVVHHSSVIGVGYNLREKRQSPTAHAEIIAIESAAHVLGSWRLTGSSLYVSLEPCLMCVGASLLARIDTIVFGASDPKGGACGSCFQAHDHPSLNHRIAVRSGVLASASSHLLRTFFQARRDKT